MTNMVVGYTGTGLNLPLPAYSSELLLFLKFFGVS